MTNFENINKNLCHYCGTCIGICPTNCLSMLGHENIIFDRQKCIDCGLCYKNCPGIEFSFPKARQSFAKLCSKDIKFDDSIGQYDSIFIGQSNDENILKQSSSGGLVPSALIYALKNKIVEGVILVTKSKASALGYKISIARTKDEILERSSSLYHVIPINVILKALGKINISKLAYVGLPCHAEAIRKLQMNGNEQAKKIRLILGIFCGLNQSFDATEFILKNMKIKKQDVAEMSYRKGGWPGYFYVRTNQGKEYRLEKEACDITNYMFMFERCMLCYNFTNEFADISFGDAWSKRPSKFGWNDIIVRTELGKKLLEAMNKDKIIKLENSDLNAVLKSHPGNFSFKKKGIFYRMKKVKQHPEYGLAEKKFGFKTNLFSFLYLKFFRIMHLSAAKKIISLLPIKLAGNIALVPKKIVKGLLLKR